MTSPTHVYVTAHGSYGSGSWAGETAQFGLRLAVMDTLDEPAKGTVFTPLANGDVVLAQGSQAGTHGTLTKTFDFRMGPTGSVVNWDAAHQIDIAEDFWTFLDSLKASIISTFRWTHIKQCPIGADGRAIGYSSVYNFTTPLAGTGTAQLPPQCAIAISLRAPITGRRGRGRIYIPAIGQNQVDSSAVIGGSAGSGFRTAAATLIANLQDSPGIPQLVPVVAVMSANSATAVRPSQVRTGNRVDTIRSRREQVAEVYTSTDL